MFYLKYRPKTIDQLDNSSVKGILTKILSQKQLPHALLFVGQKGTGKTSTARIIAKAVNCLNKEKLSDGKPGIEPCNSCKNCLSIDSSSSPDVIELDAASNRGIDDIKNLIKESNFFPMSNRFRVFIIDEAHMITNEAFNALLKTLEEPPNSVIFILATTNLEKIPKTIISRCSLVDFGKAKKPDIISMLKKIVTQEKLSVNDQLLSLIAQHSDHSFRDATKLLEELATQDKLTLDEGKAFLGLLQENFFTTLAKGNLKDSLIWIEEFSAKGGSIKNLLNQLLLDLQEGLLVKNGIPRPDQESEVNLTTTQIVQLMKLLTEAYNNLRISPIESLPLEIAVVEFYNQRKEVKQV